jgi:DNA-binding response OmpR family regulator
MVLDLGLPDLDGLEVLEVLRACGCQTRVVIATARSTADDRARAAALGVHAYLTKPFSVAELVDSLRTAPRSTGDRPGG